MSSLTRALFNATNSVATKQTEIEFALAVGPPLHLGVVLLTIVLFSLTYLDPVTKRSSVSAHALRVVCGLGAIYGFYDFGFGHYVIHDDRISRQVRSLAAWRFLAAQTPDYLLHSKVYCGLAPISLYGIMRIIDASFVTMIGNDVPPRWRSLSTNEVLPLPTTFSGRLGYAFDLLTSMRGISWYSDRRWDFTSSNVAAQQARIVHTSRAQYVRRHLLWWMLFYLLIDVIDTCVKLLPFDAAEMYPVSEGLSIPQQLFCSVAICVWTYLAIASEFTLLALTFVGLLGVSAPTSWVSMFEYPLLASSLSDFWGKRWHYIFRRTFERMLVPFIPRSSCRLPPPPRKQTIRQSARLHPK